MKFRTHFVAASGIPCGRRARVAFGGATEDLRSVTCGSCLLLLERRLQVARRRFEVWRPYRTKRQAEMFGLKSNQGEVSA